MDRLAIATHETEIAPYVALASRFHVGLEIQAYGYHPDLLDEGWRDLLARHRRVLRSFEGEIALHGAFYDMASGSIDPQVVDLTRRRYLLNLHIAAVLGARHVVFHANFLPFIRRPEYLPDWVRRQVDFWGNLLEEAERLGLVVALENMWEPSPEIIARVLEEVDSPRLGACLDVGHVYLYADSLSFTRWLDRLEGWIVHCHINNHRGQYDEHLPLDAPGGLIDYRVIYPRLHSLPRSPLISLEIEGLENIERSLRFLRSDRIPR